MDIYKAWVNSRTRIASFREWLEFSQLDEARTIYKGWIHPGDQKSIIWQTISKPWHVQKIVTNPKEFGYTEEDLLKVLGGGRLEWADMQDWKDLISGVRSIEYNIEGRLIDDGWVKITVDLKDHSGAGDIYAKDLEAARAALKMLEKKVVMLPFVTTYVWTGNNPTGSFRRKVRITTPEHFKTFVKTGRLPAGAV
ncbi:MAG: hypothetical protein ACO3QV_05360 [Candidatus Nanopelagicaceae bacterium]